MTHMGNKDALGLAEVVLIFPIAAVIMLLLVLVPKKVLMTH